MANLRPVIFIFPISGTLTKLKDEMKNDPTVEIHEVDNINEVVQLFLTVAPAMLLTSDVKKAFRVLATVEKHYKKTSSKMMLLHKEKIPLKAQQKGEKLGLTSIEEPISPKSLVYKVNLMLKSLPMNKVDPNKGELELKKNEEAKGQSDKGGELSLQNVNNQDEKIESSNDGTLKGNISGETSANQKIDKFMELKVKKKIKIEIEDDTPKKDKEENQSAPELEVEAKKKPLKIDFIKEDKKKQVEDDEKSKIETDDVQTKKKKQKLGIDFDEEENSTEKEQTSNEETIKKSKKSLKIDFAEEEESSEKAEKKNKGSNEFDKYLHNANIKKAELDIEEEKGEGSRPSDLGKEELSKKKKSTKDQIEFAQEEIELSLESDKNLQGKEGAKKKSMRALLLEEEEIATPLKEGQSTGQEHSPSLKKKSKLNIEEEIAAATDDDSEKSVEEKNKAGKKKKASIDFIDDEKHEKEGGEEELAEEVESKKFQQNLELEDENSLDKLKQPLSSLDEDHELTDKDKKSKQEQIKSSKKKMSEITFAEEEQMNDGKDGPSEEDDGPGLRTAKRLKLLSGLDEAIDAFDKNAPSKKDLEKKNKVKLALANEDEDAGPEDERSEESETKKKRKETKDLNLSDEELTREADELDKEEESLNRDKSEALQIEDEKEQAEFVAQKKKQKNEEAQWDESEVSKEEDPVEDQGAVIEFVRKEQEEEREKKRVDEFSDLKGTSHFQEEEKDDGNRAKNKADEIDNRQEVDLSEDERHEKKKKSHQSSELEDGDSEDQHKNSINTAADKKRKNTQVQDEDEKAEAEFTEQGKKRKVKKQESHNSDDDLVDEMSEEKLSTHGLSLLIKSLHQYHSPENQQSHFIAEAISFFKAQGGFAYLALTPPGSETIEFLNSFPDISQKNGDCDLVNLLIQSDSAIEKKWKLQGQSFIFFYPLQLRSGAKGRAILAYPNNILDQDQKWRAQAQIESLRPWLEDYQLPVKQLEHTSTPNKQEAPKNILSGFKNWFKRMAS